ncbi:hypothetical protein MHLP_00730 [Candidatus Mycoplasma haematolamae str. Purdue]|uniref:Uncharacterized protein n=1 Tax=Mycoplasma haematolamae (strain Purdue) TaxID=1212765 RepID=I7CEQ1_MYCHA|nr:hypothetical protein MHLP_00730 [Candidatus Mycoplasma haematolamae str. Purdue]
MQTNFLFVMCAALLTTAGLVFFFLLLPIYLNLDLFYYNTPKFPVWLQSFWMCWHHFVTPLTFINLLAHRCREGKYSVGLSRREGLRWFGSFWLVNCILNFYFCFFTKQKLPYGAVANWNWNNSSHLLEGDQGKPVMPAIQQIVYNFQLSFFSFFLVGAATFTSLVVYWMFFDLQDKRLKRWSVLPLGFLATL